jgi:uncharacterized protein
MRFKTAFILLFLNFAAFSQKNVFDIARTGTLDEIKILFEENPKLVNEVNENGYSALILATYRSNNDVAKYLIEVIDDIDYTCSLGSALMAATYKSNTEIVESLLMKGANPDKLDENGQTALMLAAQFGNKDIVSLLIEYKADKTILNKEGKSAFEFAVFSGNNEIIELLK